MTATGHRNPPAYAATPLVQGNAGTSTFDAGPLTDATGRRFRYLRLSVTEACNFRCSYCLPGGYRKSGGAAFLNAQEIGRLAHAFARLGVVKVRLTGGEPTVRRDIGEIIARVAKVDGIAKVALTTNGWNLRRHVGAWRDAGLTNLNVSIDDLEPSRFKALTGHDRLEDIVAGLDLALSLGVPAVKVNAVLLRSTAETGFDRFADFVKSRPVTVRFIELMRTADNADYFAAQYLAGDAVRTWLAQNGWMPRPRGFDDGPAIEFAHPGYAGRLGLIAPYAPGFCDSCNRLRVTARGRLRLCLFGAGGLDLRDLLADDTSGDRLAQRVQVALGAKPDGHRLRESRFGDTRNLAQFGG